MVISRYYVSMNHTPETLFTNHVAVNIWSAMKLIRGKYGGSEAGPC